MSLGIAVSLAQAGPVLADEVCGLVERDLVSPGDAAITWDTARGLEWLDLPLTTELSYHDIVNGVGNSWVADGWRHATSQEMCDLFGRHGAIPSPCPRLGYWVEPAPLETVLAMQALFGVTDMIGPGSQRAGGFFDDGFDEGLAGWGSITQSYYQAIDGFEVERDDILLYEKGPRWGHFLVRTGAVGPGTIVLVGPEGDGASAPLDAPNALAVGADGVLVVAAKGSDNVLVAKPGEAASLLLDDAPGPHGWLSDPAGIARSASGHVYVSGAFSGNVIEIAPDGTATEIADATGAGAAAPLSGPAQVALGPDGAVFVAGRGSDNVLRIDPDGTVTEVVGAAGDGMGGVLDGPVGLAVDGEGNVFVAGSISDNVLRISPEGVVTELVDAAGDGKGNGLDTPLALTLDAHGRVIVAGADSNDVLRVEHGGSVTLLVDASGDGQGNVLDRPVALAADALGRVYVAAQGSDVVLRVSRSGRVTTVLAAAEIDCGALLDQPSALAVDEAGHLYVAGRGSDNVLRFVSPIAVPGLSPAGLVALTSLMACGTLWRLGRQPRMRRGPTRSP